MKQHKNPSLSPELLLNNKADFIKIFSAYYPIPEPWLEEYSTIWDWSLLSRNNQLTWSEELIGRFEAKWTWSYGGLSSNEALPWSTSFIEKFKDRWSWYHLGFQPAIINNQEMLALCFPHWDDWCQNNLFGCSMPALTASNHHWAPHFFENCSNLNWKFFSKYDHFPWTTDFIDRHIRKWDWTQLSTNKGLPWSQSFIAAYKDKWDWHWLSQNSALPWSIELIDAFTENWDWEQLCGNEAIPWDEKWLEHFKERCYWATPVFLDYCYQYVKGLINTKSIRWTPALFEEFNPYIEKHFRKLRASYRDDFVMTATEYWTSYQDPQTWSSEYFMMLIEKSLQEPSIEFINWFEIEANAAKLHFVKNILPGYKRIEHLVANYNYNMLSDNFLEILEKKIGFFSDDHALLQGEASHALELIHKDPHRCDWNELSRNPNLTIDIIVQYADKCNWWMLAQTKLHNYHIDQIPVEARLDLQQLVSQQLLEDFLRVVS